MASKDGEENFGCNTETEEETVALQKKRSRRVSFAETTAIHLFVREEDYETPPDSSNKSSDEPVRSENEAIMQLLESSDDSDSDEINRDNEVAFKGSFIRPIGSPSPGSNFGSATSNDEDNFFGPVSTDFIKSRRLSDSAASDENHDITMDSTAFSMHFRSLVRSTSGGEFKTPTGTHLAFEERTPGPISTVTSTGDLMSLTGARKPVACRLLRADKVTDSGHSDDMSLVCENQHRYDYGKLPAELDVLLAEGGKDMGAVSITNDVEFSNSSSLLVKGTISAVDGNRYDSFYLKNNQDTDVCMQKASADANSAFETNIDEGKDGGAAATLGEETHSNSCNVNIDLVKITPEVDQIKGQVPLTNGVAFDKDKGFGKDAIGVTGKFASPLSSARLNLDSEQQTRSSLAGSVSSLLAKRRQIFKVLADSSNEQLNLIPSTNELCDKESIKHVSSMSNSTKYVSRLKRLEAFPFASTSKAERNASRLISPGSFTRSKAKNNLLGYRSKDISVNHVDVPVASLEAHFSNVAEKNGELKNLSKLETGSLRFRDDPEVSSNIEEMAKDVEFQTFSITFPSQDQSTKMTCAIVSPSSTATGKKERENSMSIDNHAEEAPQNMASNSTLAEISFIDTKYNSVSGTHAKSASPPVNKLDRKVLASPNSEKTFSTNVNQQGESHLDATPNKANYFASRTENMAHDANVHLFVGKHSDTPRSNSLTSKYDENEETLQKSCNICGSNSTSSLKRKYGASFDEAEYKNDEIPLLHQNSKLVKYQIEFAEGGGVSHNSGDDTTLRHLGDAFTSFCRAIRLLLSPWSDKLDLALIETLNDALIHLEKKKNYELLQHNFCFQKDYACFLKDKRMMNTKLLLYRNVYEKAKLQLMHLKRDKLLDQLQRLKLRVQESETLISSCRLVGQKDIQVNCSESESCHTKMEERSLVPDNISSLREELEVSDSKIKNLIESVNSHFKVKENQTCSQKTKFAKDLLKQRVSCRSLQLCEIESLKTVNGQQNILFDHLGFMSQRFIFSSKNSTSEVSVSNKLNNLKISKMFLSMDTNIAFSFVLSGDTVLTCTGLRTITRETQKTNLLLHNLLDVIEEVASAMSELKNLTHSKFCQPSAEKLDLQFCFCDFKSGARVTLNIDVSCLNRGVYPSQVLPSEVQVTAAGKHEFSQLLLSSIGTAVRGLRCGYMRIITLCRCISRVIKASSGKS